MIILRILKDTAVNVALCGLIIGCSNGFRATTSSPTLPGSQDQPAISPDQARPSENDKNSIDTESQPSEVTEVEQFAIFERTFQHSGTYTNPYQDVTALATFTNSNGKTVTIPLFWNGNQEWKVRFSPDVEGIWRWSIDSNDSGLDGQSGSLTTVASTSNGGIRVNPAFPYHFEYQDGTPFWLLGDTHWHAFGVDQPETLNRTTFEQYIDIRASQGFNFIHANVLDPGQNEGGSAFHNLASEEVNPEFWQEVDARIEYMNQKGITAMLFLTWSHKESGWRKFLPWGDPDADWRQFPSQEARLRYAQFLTARYSAYNVAFSVSGEWDEFGSQDMYQAIAQMIETTDPHDRLITIHPGGRASVEEFANEPWMSFGDYQQNYETLHSKILEAREHNKPVINSEYAYYLRDQNEDGEVDKPNSSTLEEIRHASWDIVMAGGYFVTGWGTTYFGGGRDPGPFNPTDPRNADWEEDVQHIRKLFTELDWWKLEPHPELLSGAGTHYALAEIGKQYVVYTRGSNEALELSLGNRDIRTYQVRLFDPRTGIYTSLANYRGNTAIRLEPPDNQDWLFLITDDSNR
ncbi:MAG: DUF4038 domain-containing protein [Cyanobacteria bacterium CRU_2_1]|nr:DUF4038 domain-containing protein [Cyanobacteria bacterium CRU_2_1]